jgi:ubiquinone/menaquinone biosynthesis C-methylase UbiE/uncharacterized protein YbaR (Trm112 family)
MKKELLQWIKCPHCKGKLALTVSQYAEEDVKEGVLSCACGKTYEVTNFIPRFVKSDKYVKSFSFEWKLHHNTQLDSANIGTKMERASEKAFQSRIDFPLEELKGKLILDVGCGMGRYAEIATRFGGDVIGVDLSYAVDTALKNLGLKKNVHLVQADVFNLPFNEEIFDFIYSYGMLHHTSDCKMAFKQLPRLLRKNGIISIFLYSSYNKAIVYSSNFWRLITTRIPKPILYCFCFISIPLYFLYRIPLIGRIGKMMFVIPMIPDWRWRVLDTFDWYSARYQSKHTHWEVFKWFEEENLRDIKIFENEVTMLGRKGI